MSDSLTGDRNARAATLVPYADVSVLRQNEGAMIGGMLSLWPVLGAQTLGLMGQQTGPRDFSAASVAPSATLDTTAAAGAAATPAVNEPMAVGSGSGPAASVDSSTVTAATLNPPLSSSMFAATLNGGTAVQPQTTPAAAAFSIPLDYTYGTLFSSGAALIFSESPVTVLMNAGAPIIPVAQLNGLINGLDPLLLLLEQTLQNKVFTQVLPLIGTQLSTAFNQSIGALTAFQTLQTNVFNALASLVNPTAQVIQDALNAALNNAGFAGTPVSISVTNGVLSVAINGQHTSPFPVNLASDIGLPNLHLTTQGIATANVSFAVNVQSTVDASGNWTLSNPNGTALSVGLNVGATNFAANATLGFLEVIATNPHNDTGLIGTFALDTQGNASFTGSATLDIHLKTDLSTATLPSVSADLEAGWTFGASIVGGSDITAFGSTPTIALDNITYDLGSFVDNFLRPIMDALRPVLTPLEDAFKVLNYDLTPMFRLLLGDTALTTFDHAGAVDSSGQDMKDGKISLIDFLKLAKPNTNLAPLVTFLNILQKLTDFASVMDSLGLTTPSTPFDVGSFTIGQLQDIRSASFDITQIVPNVTKAPDDITAIVNGLSGIHGNTGTASVADILTTMLTTPDFSVPVMTDGTKAFQFLFGGDSNIFDANLPLPSFNFGQIDSNGAPVDPQQIASFPLIANINLVLDAAFQANFGLNIGFDTTGLQAYAAQGFHNPDLIARGLFVADPVVNGVVQPLVSVSGALELLVQADAIVASIGGGGDVSGTLALEFSQPGKNYLYQLASEFSPDPLAPFAASGRFTAGFDAVVKVFGQTVKTWPSPRVTLFSFNSSGASALPSHTFWSSGSGDFETKDYWTPTFGLTSLNAGGSAYYYGDATVDVNSLLTFQGPLEAELTSLTLPATSEIDVTSGVLYIDGTTIDSVNAGIIQIDGAGNLTLQSALNNTGQLILGMQPPPAGNESPSLTIVGLVNLYGKGSVVLSDDDTNTISGAGATAFLWNVDNKITGAGTIAVQLLNQGTVLADGQHWLVLADPVTNQGVLGADNNGAVIGGALAGGLRIRADVDNTGGLMGTGPGGAILIEDGVTISGGALTTNAGPNGGVIEMSGQATFDGGTDGLQINGNIHVGIGSTLNLTGLIFSKAFSATQAPAGIVSSGGTVVLHNTTIRDGLLNALPPVIGTAGAILVSGTATLDGAAGNNVLALDGFVQVGAGNTMVLDGTINPDLAGAGIELSGGMLVIGNATEDSAVLGTDASGNGGTLRMDDATGSVVTGADGASLLTNNWTIQGTGLLGSGQLAIVNTQAGVIAGTGAGTLLVDGGGPLGNAGLIGAAGGTLELHGGVINTAGTIGADNGVTVLDGATIGGGLMRTSNGGSIQTKDNVLFDGTAGGVTLATGADVDVEPTDTLTLAGTIANHGTLSVIGDGNGPSIATVIIANTVTLTGGGAVHLTDRSGLGFSKTQIITGDLTKATLDNVDNTLSGVGQLSLFGLTNESSGTIDASGGTFSVTAANGVTNAGLLEATSGGTLGLAGSFSNLTGTIGATDGVTELDIALVIGGMLRTSGTGSIRAESGVSGLTGGVTMASGAQVVVDPGATIGINGTLTNHGTLTVLGDPGRGDAELVVIGATTLTGGGSVLLADRSDSGSSATQRVIGTTASDTLDNIDNTISGTGQIGAAQLTVTNEKQGIIDAWGGALTIDTGAKTILNAGLLESTATGTLILRSNVNDIAGTIGANGGAVDLAGITITGGVFTGSTGGTIHASGSTTLDGSAHAVTLAAGGQMAVDPGAKLTLKGTFIDQGSLRITGDGTALNDGELVIDGLVTLGGAGTVSIAYLPGGGQITPGLIGTTPSGGTIDHVSGTIDGSGAISLSALINEAGAVIDGNGTYGSMKIDVLSTIDNHGTMESVGGDGLTVDSAVANSGLIQALNGSVGLGANVTNSGTIFAGPGGAIGISAGATVTNTGLVEAGTGNGVVFLTGVITGAASKSQVLATGRIEFISGGEMSGGSLSVAAGGALQFDSGTKAGLLSNLAVTNAGTMNIFGRNMNPLVTPASTMEVDGLVTVAGSGLILLTDVSGAFDPTGQIITGASVGATLDNIGNTIRGVGELGAGKLTLINEAKGTVEALGGTIVLDTGAVAASNQGLFEAVGGTLLVRTVLDSNGGGTVSAVNNKGTSGIILLDGGVLRGGTITTDLKDPNSLVEVTSKSGTLDGTAGTLTLATGAEAVVGAGQTMTITGAIANAGTILVGGNPYVAPATLIVAGTATLSGGGHVILADASGLAYPNMQIVTGVASTSTLDNEANTISGYGSLGAGTLTLINGAQGTIDAIGGTLTVDTGGNTTINKGLLEATGGQLIQRGLVDGTQGGTVAALAANGVSGVVVLDGATLLGGTIKTDLADRASVVQNSANGATLDGAAGAVTIAAGAQMIAGAGRTLVVKGAIANFGTLSVAGTPYVGTAIVQLAGAVTLTGGGLLSLVDISGLGYAATQTVIGGKSSDSLDNVDNLISGYGSLGAGTLTLTNETKGTIEALGTLTVDTAANTILNHGLMEAMGGTLILRSVVDSLTGGTISARHSGTVSGVVLLDGGALRGGTFTSDLADAGSLLSVTGAGGTLDGTAGTVTIATGAHAEVTAADTLVVEGAIANHGTLSMLGSPYSGTAVLLVAGGLTLSGGGLVLLADSSGLNYPTTQKITGTAASDTLDNVDNLISGYGSLGGGTLTLTNESKGVIEATVATLTLDTGANVITNKGLLEGVGGTLRIDSDVANSATIAAGAGGGVVVASVVTNTSLVTALSGGTLTVQGGINGASSAIKVAAGGTMMVDGGTLSGGTVTNATTGNIGVTTNGGTLANLALVNAGTVSLFGNAYAGTAVAHIAGTVSLSGGGVVSMIDTSALYYSTNQIITGAVAADELDNVDNTIFGYGSIGAGTLALINEAKGTIEATAGTLTVDTGATVITNQGLFEAFGGTLTLRGVVDSTAGGTIASLSNGGATSSIVLLDGATLRGGSIVTDLTHPDSAVGLTTNGGTLDGSAGAVTLTAGAHLVIAGTQTLTAQGSIVDHGTISVLGNAYSGPAATLRLNGGTLTMSGGALLSMDDSSGLSYDATQVVTGTAASDTVDNALGTISGHGHLGAGSLTLINAANSTIEATGGTLTVDTGAVATINKGLLEAVTGTLRLSTDVANTGAILAGPAGAVIVEAAVANNAQFTAVSGGTITVHGGIANASGTVTVAGGGGFILDGGTLSGGTLSNVGDVEVTLQGGVLADVAFTNSGTANVVGNAYVAAPAVLRIGGAVRLDGGGRVKLTDGSNNGYSTTQAITGINASATLDNVDNTISGAGSLGAGKLTLINEVNGTIEASGGTLTVDTGAVTLDNKGTLEGIGGTLLLSTAITSSGLVLAGAGGAVVVAGTVTNAGLVETVSGGTLTVRGAIDSTAGTVTVTGSGTMVLDGGTLQGGTLNNEASNRIDVTQNGGAIDGVAVVNSGTFSVIGNAYVAAPAVLTLGGTVGLTGGGVVSLFDGSNNNFSTTQEITGNAASATLDNVDNLISGYGSIGAGTLTLLNEAKGTIDAIIGTLTVDTGSTALINEGLMEAVDGTLRLTTAVTNSGTILAGAGGIVMIEGAVANSSLVMAAASGTVTVQGSINGALSTVTVAGGGGLVLDGGSLTGGTLGIAATGTAAVTVTGGGIAGVSVTNAGTINVIGNVYITAPADLKIGGTVTLTGGGVVSLFDGSNNGFSTTQEITGTSAAATLDNVDNLISGYGSIGAGTLTLINAAKGVIEAIGGTLTVDTGAVALTNQGLLEAVGGTLILNSAVTNSGTLLAGTGGGITIANAVANTSLVKAATGGTVTVQGGIDGALGTVTVAAGGGLILDGGSLTGGTLGIAAKGAANVTVNGGGLTDVTVTNAGTVNVIGNAYIAAPADLKIGGSVTLTGGGVVSLFDGSNNNFSSTQEITGASAASTLDNVDNLISGYGSIGAGTLTLINAAKGTIAAIGGTLTVDTGAVAVTNLGLLEAASPGGVLDLRSSISNAGGTISGDGGLVKLDGMTVSGGALSSSGAGGLEVVNNATLDGTANLVTLISGALLTIDATETLTLTGAVSLAGTVVNAGTVVGDIAVSGSGNAANLAGATVTGGIKATAPGETIVNLGTVLGVVTLAGGDRLVTGAGAVFTGGITALGGNNTLEIASGVYALTGFNAPGTPRYTTLQIDAGASVSTDASDILAGVSLINHGSISFSAFEASMPVLNSGEITGDVTLTSGVPLVNTIGGTISGAGLAVIEGKDGPASVMNSGIIDPATFGVLLPAGGTVTNNPGAVIEGTVAGVSISGGAGTVTNAGTIIGGGIDAVTLAAGFANVVVIDPGAVFTGLVDGGNAPGGAFGSTLELGVGDHATTLSGLGSQFINFSTVSVDPGAFVHLTGTNTLVSGVALTDQGTLIIDSGASLTEAGAAVVSGAAGLGASVAVDGAGSSWTSASGMVLGDNAPGSLIITNLGGVTAGSPAANAAVRLGVSAGGDGSLILRGGSLTVNGQLDLGQAGAGHLVVARQSTVVIGGTALTGPARGLEIGQFAGGSGDVTVSGAKSLLNNTGQFVVGDSGLGYLSIASGATVITNPGTGGLAGLVIGNASGAAGSTVNVSGAGSNLQVSGLLDVGVNGSGSLRLSGGATVVVGSLDAGEFAPAVGQISLSGAGTSLTVLGAATVADDGTGVLSVLDGASFSADSLTIGSQGNSSGALIVSGAGSVISLTGSLNIGTALGVGDLTIGPGGAVHAAVVNLQGQVVLEGGNLDPTVTIINQGQTAGGNGTIQAGFIVDEGVVQAGGTKPSQRLLIVDGTVVGGGTLTVNGSVQPSGPVGVLQINASGTLELTGPVLNAATTTFTDNLTQPGTYTINNSVVDVTFADAKGVLLLDNIAGFGGTITSFTGGDQFVIKGGVLSNLGVGNSNTLTFSDSGVNAGSGGIDSIIFGSAVSAANFNIVNGNTVQVACFAAGTRIETAAGPVAVEDLTVGALVVTEDGRAEPIVWIGSRTIDCARHPKPETVWPVRVRAGAFGAGLPVRDLYLSPDHAVFVNGVLAPVKLLMNGTSIAQVKRHRVTYFHVELPRHDVILAESLAVESYLDTGDRADFGGDVTRLFPDFAARLAPDAAARWETRGAALLVLAGPQLEAARRRVAASTHSGGHKSLLTLERRGRA